MADISHTMGSDLTLSPSGDLASADGAVLTQQRVLRRLLTSLQGYVWHPTYGAGLPGFVGRVIRKARIKSVILRQMQMERGVGPTPSPTVTIEAPQGLNTVTAHIRYADKGGASQQLSVTP